MAGRGRKLALARYTAPTRGLYGEVPAGLFDDYRVGTARYYKAVNNLIRMLYPWFASFALKALGRPVSHRFFLPAMSAGLIAKQCSKQKA